MLGVTEAAGHCDRGGGSHGLLGPGVMKVAIPAPEALGRQHLEQAPGECGNQRPV